MGVGSPWNGGRSRVGPQTVQLTPQSLHGGCPWACTPQLHQMHMKERVLLLCLRVFEVGDAGTGELTLESLSSFLPLLPPPSRENLALPYSSFLLMDVPT